MTRYIIFDLDGCIADDRERLSLIDHSQPDPWAKYHEGCYSDPLINKTWVRMGRFICTPIVFTARPECVREQTASWLRDVARLDVKWLFMRPDGDNHTPSVELKERFLLHCFNRHGIGPESISMALDDRIDVLAMYKEYTILTRQLSYPERAMV